MSINQYPPASWVWTGNWSPSGMEGGCIVHTTHILLHVIWSWHMISWYYSFWCVVDNISLHLPVGHDFTSQKALNQWRFNLDQPLQFPHKDPELLLLQVQHREALKREQIEHRLVQHQLAAGVIQKEEQLARLEQQKMALGLQEQRALAANRRLTKQNVDLSKSLQKAERKVPCITC